MSSAAAKKNAKRHLKKRAKAAEADVLGKQQQWALQVILKNIMWFRHTLSRPFTSKFKTLMLKKHLENGSLNGTLHGWLKESSVHTSYFVSGVLDVAGGAYINTTCVKVEFVTKDDRFVLTHSNNLYKLGRPMIIPHRLGYTLSIEAERQHVLRSFVQWMKVKVL